MQDVMFNEIEECDYGVESDSEMYGVELKCQVLSEKCSQLKVKLESGETGTIVGCLENNGKFCGLCIQTLLRRQLNLLHNMN